MSSWILTLLFVFVNLQSYKAVRAARQHSPLYYTKKLPPSSLVFIYSLFPPMCTSKLLGQTMRSLKQKRLSYDTVIYHLLIQLKRMAVLECKDRGKITKFQESPESAKV